MKHVSGVHPLTLLTLCTVLLVSGCSRKGVPKADLRPGSMVPFGELKQMWVVGNTLTFCDARGIQAFDLLSGTKGTPSEHCDPKFDGMARCDTPEIQFSSPQDVPDDRLDVGSISYWMRGRIHYCDSFNKIVVAASLSEVVLIDPTKLQCAILSQDGSGPVATSSDWVAWKEGEDHPQVHVIRLQDAPWTSIDAPDGIKHEAWPVQATKHHK